MVFFLLFGCLFFSNFLLLGIEAFEEESLDAHTTAISNQNQSSISTNRSQVSGVESMSAQSKNVSSWLAPS